MSNPNSTPAKDVNSSSQASINLGVGLSLAVITFLALSLRLISNFKINKKLAIDDYLCVMAFTLASTCFGLGMSLSSPQGLGPAAISALFKRIFAFGVLSGPAIATPKIAILALYMRLFNPAKWFRVVSWITLSILIMFFCASASVAAAGCAPVHRTWNFRPRCASNMFVLGMVGGVLSIVVDILLLCLPLPIIYRLKLAPGKKLGLMIVFMAGILAVLSSTLSLAFRVRIHHTNGDVFNRAVVQSSLFAEVYITILVSCCPAIYSFWCSHFGNSVFCSGIRSKYSSSSPSRKSSVTPSRLYERPHKMSDSSRVKGADDYDIALLRVGHVPRMENSWLHGVEGRRLSITKSITIEQWSQEKV